MTKNEIKDLLSWLKKDRTAYDLENYALFYLLMTSGLRTSGLCQLKPVLLKQKVFTNIVSLWNFNGQYIEITQNTNGHYDIYLMSEREAKEWDKDRSYCEDLAGQKIGDPPDVIVSESLQIRRKKAEAGK